MSHLLWDASGLTKRYALEVGTPTANALFTALPAPTMATTFLGYTETFAALWRKRNRGQLADGPFHQAVSALRLEVLGSRFRLVTAYDTEVVSAIEYVQKYSLNASDAIILTAYLRYARPVNDICILVAADGRLVKAAEAEGLRSLSPETVSVLEVAALLAAL